MAARPLNRPAARLSSCPVRPTTHSGSSRRHEDVGRRDRSVDPSKTRERVKFDLASPLCGHGQRKAPFENWSQIPEWLEHDYTAGGKSEYVLIREIWRDFDRYGNKKIPTRVLL